MSLGILNYVASSIAKNSLGQTAANQQKTLQQLSTGLRINSSADDSAGLSIANGMQANIAALVQSQSNANNGIGFLQVADSALNQVSGLLNRAVTLATEAASGGLTSQQRGSANTEYQSILSEINQIGAATEFNGTQVFTNGNTSPASLTAGGSAIAGTINPADTLTGGFDVTSTIPGAGGTTTGVTVTDSGGTSASATITPGAALSGSLTVTSTGPGSPDPITFTASSDGSTITSSQITAGSTLSGNLVIDSSGGNASDSDTIDLANYQGLASSNSTTATAAANQLAADMTTAMRATTGSTYTASIGGGLLRIQTSNPVTAPSPASVTLTGGQSLNGIGFDLGSTLSGSVTFTSSGALASGSATINFANYQGLTSSDTTAQNDALTQLGDDLTEALGATTGSIYTVAYLPGAALSICSSNANEQFQVGDSNVTATPALGTQNVTMFSNIGSDETYSNSIAPGSVASGMLNISATTYGGGTATASIDLGDPAYSGFFSNSYSTAFTALENLQNALQAALDPGGVYPDVSFIDGGLQIYGAGANSLSASTSSIEATLSGSGETLSVGNNSNGEQSTSSQGASVQTTVDLAGQTTSTLQSYLSQQLGSDYAVSYNNTSGALSILLNNGNADGYTSFSTSGSPQQTVGGSSPITATTAVSLAGLTKTNLASSLLTQLGSDYTVSYDQTTGALSIGISTAGTSAGITSIASSNNTVVQTAASGQGLSAFDVFTGDGTSSGSTSLNVTVGALTSASVGTNNGNAGQDLSSTTLTSQTNAASALALITAAVNDISSQRGVVGANINRLEATTSDESTGVVNLTSATNSIMDADIGKTVANMTQYNVLQATGMAALQQANQAQQAVLKLIQ